jgi:hypothetical protein
VAAMEPDQKPNVIYQDVSIDDQSRIREFWWMMAMVDDGYGGLLGDAG